MITQSCIKELFSYDGDSGVLTWRQSRGRVKVGDIAGCDMKNNANIYRRVGVFGKYHPAHRIVWLYVYGYMPEFIDHIDGDGTNNRLNNLRDVSHIENHRNKRKPCTNKTGCMGIRLDRRYMSWVAYIKVRGRSLHIGSYDNIFDAVCARKSAEIKHGFHKNHGRSTHD